MKNKILLFALLLFCGNAYATLPIQRWDTKTGARVYFVENHDLPMVDASVDFPAGSAYDTKEKSGLASLTRHMLKLGAKNLSEDDIAKRLADIGAEMSGHFDADRSGLSLRTLSREKKAALSIFMTVLQSPSFDEKILEREKARIIAEIKEEKTRPGHILSENFNKTLYPTHPYGLQPEGEIESLNSLTRKDLADFYESHYTKGRAIVSIVGDLSRQEAEEIAEEIGSGLPQDRDLPALPKVNEPEKAQEKFIDNPSAQSHIALGYVGVTRLDPDYFPLFVGNYILGGGGFVSRLLNEVREKRGLAYSVSSYFYPLQEKGPFEISLQTKKDQTKQSLAIVRSVLKDFVDKGPTQKELLAAKQNIVGGFALRIDSNRKILEYLGVIGFYGLPLTYLDDFTKNVEKVRLADIKKAFSDRVKPEKMVTVVVGGQ